MIPALDDTSMSADWTLTRGDGPLVATAIHEGSGLRPEVAGRLRLTDEDRRREEDPYTELWTTCAPTRIVVHTSRFEVDLNRPLERAVYRTPEDAWGLPLWDGPLPDGLAAVSRAKHVAYYEQLRALCDELVRVHGGFVLLDIHSYNHRRAGPDGPAAPVEGNPVVNLGTGTMDRTRWAGLVDRFVAEMSVVSWQGAPLDVRENVRFRGGEQCRWVHEHYPETGCALALEFKKVFMDEWTGTLDREAVDALTSALAGTVPGLLESLASALAAGGGR